MVEKSNIQKKELTEKIEMTPGEAVQHGIMLGATQGFKAFGKKGNFNMMSAQAKALVVFGIMIGMGLLILGKFQDATPNGSKAELEIGNVMGLFSDLTVWGGIILIVVMAWIIMKYLGVFGND